jgi:hypothetical protein
MESTTGYRPPVWDLLLVLVKACRYKGPRYGVHYRLLSTSVGSFTCSSCSRTRDHGMESTTGYCPSVWDLLLALAAHVQGITVWSPLQATVHQCGIFCLSWHRLAGTRNQSVLVSSFLYSLCECPGRDRTRSLTLLGLQVKRVDHWKCSVWAWLKKGSHGVPIA